MSLCKGYKIKPAAVSVNCNANGQFAKSYFYCIATNLRCSFFPQGRPGERAGLKLTEVLLHLSPERGTN